jgi:hypothetical protein
VDTTVYTATIHIGIRAGWTLDVCERLYDEGMKLQKESPHGASMSKSNELKQATAILRAIICARLHYGDCRNASIRLGTLLDSGDHTNLTLFSDSHLTIVQSMNQNYYSSFLAETSTPSHDQYSRYTCRNCGNRIGCTRDMPLGENWRELASTLLQNARGSTN